MKKVTKNTTLRQGNKVYQPRFVMPDDKSVIWVDYSKHVQIYHGLVGKYVWSEKHDTPIIFGEHEDSCLEECFQIVAQSSRVIEGVPTINIFALENTSFKNFTLKDIEKVYKLSRAGLVANSNSNVSCHIDKLLSLEEIIEKVSQISEIIIDEQFNIIGYE